MCSHRSLPIGSPPPRGGRIDSQLQENDHYNQIKWMNQSQISRYAEISSAGKLIKRCAISLIHMMRRPPLTHSCRFLTGGLGNPTLLVLRCDRLRNLPTTREERAESDSIAGSTCFVFSLLLFLVKLFSFKKSKTAR